MDYSETEIRLAQQLCDQAIAKGTPKRRAIAVMVGLSNPARATSIDHETTYRDYLSLARKQISSGKTSGKR
jgi:hypothetical protein